MEGGATLSEIRAANEAADKNIYTQKHDILSPTTMFPPLPSASSDEIKSYVTTKIVEYLDEEETTLIEFIMKELGKGVKTVALLEEMKEVLEEDAEEFVLGLYRRMTE
jgi:RNA-binding protein 25